MHMYKTMCIYIYIYTHAHMYTIFVSHHARESSHALTTTPTGGPATVRPIFKLRIFKFGV